MVSGLVTSPQDHHERCPWSSRRSRSLGSRGPRISSGAAMRMLMKSKLELFGSRPLRKSITLSPLLVALGSRAESDLETERLEFLHEHVERLGNAGLRQILPLHDRLVDAAASRDVVRLHRQHLLQRVRRAVRLERPHFHFAEALAAELRLAGERLLR